MDAIVAVEKFKAIDELRGEGLPSLWTADGVKHGSCGEISASVLQAILGVYFEVQGICIHYKALGRRVVAVERHHVGRSATRRMEIGQDAGFVVEDLVRIFSGGSLDG